MAEQVVEQTGTQPIEIEDALEKELEHRTNANEWTKGNPPVDEKSKEHEKFMGVARWVPYESFEEMEVAEEAEEKADEIRELSEVLPSMISNVVYDNEPQEIEAKTENIFSGFMKRLKSLVGMTGKEKTEEVAAEEVVTDGPDTGAKDNTNMFMVYKGKDGQMLWLSSYSNNIRDDDSPPEIISSKSHTKFVERVDKGELELPELWLWHESDWKLGEATVMAYDKDAGAAIASGFFYKEAEEIAVAIEKGDIDWGVSHGMPSMQIKRSAEDPTIIIEHITKEISPLPHSAAANKFAGFTVLKEANMALQEEKRSMLEEAGIPVDALDNLDKMNKAKSDVADSLELDRKESEVEPEPQEDEVQEVVAEDEAKEQEVVFTEKQLEELQSAFATFGEKLIAEIPAVVQSAVEEKMQPLIEEQKEIKETEVQDIIANTPAASLSEILFSGALLKAQSATEAEETKVDGRTKLAKSGPEEADFEDDGQPYSATASLIKSITSGDYKNISA